MTAPGTTLADVAAACNLTPRRLQQLANDGVIPRAARGKYDLLASLRAYVRYLQQAMSSRASIDDDGEVTTSKQLRHQLLGAQADREVFELAKARGEVISLDDHEAILATLVIETKERIRAIAPRVAPDLVGETSRTMVQAKVEKAIDAALMELSKVTPAMPPAPDPAPPAEQKPATPPDAKKKQPKRKRRAKKTPGA